MITVAPPPSDNGTHQALRPSPDLMGIGRLKAILAARVEATRAYWREVAAAVKAAATECVLAAEEASRACFASLVNARRDIDQVEDAVGVALAELGTHLPPAHPAGDEFAPARQPVIRDGEYDPFATDARARQIAAAIPAAPPQEPPVPPHVAPVEPIAKPPREVPAPKPGTPKEDEDPGMPGPRPIDGPAPKNDGFDIQRRAAWLLLRKQRALSNRQISRESGLGKDAVAKLRKEMYGDG